jgi:type IV pilus assembly protein PilN
MKIPINLASQPFRRDRAMVVASIAVCVLLAGTLAVLISLAGADNSQLADAKRGVSQLNAQIRRLSAEQVQLDTVLRKPENAAVLETSALINSLLIRKGLSWTRIFSDLEKRVPYNVRMVQIRPIVNAADDVSLDITVATESPAAGVSLLKALQDAPFSEPEIRLIQTPSQAEPIFKYRVSVSYAQKL